MVTNRDSKRFSQKQKILKDKNKSKKIRDLKRFSQKERDSKIFSQKKEIVTDDLR